MSCSEKFHILEIRDLSVSFRQYDKGTRQVDLPVISRLNVAVHEGEIVAVVGSSGSGKRPSCPRGHGAASLQCTVRRGYLFPSGAADAKEACAYQGKRDCAGAPERHLPGSFDEGGKAGARRKEGSGSRKAAAGAFFPVWPAGGYGRKIPFCLFRRNEPADSPGNGPDGKSKADHSGRADPGHGTGAGKKSDGGFPAVCGCGKRRAADYP